MDFQVDLEAIVGRFVDLEDTPDSYTGFGGKILAVKLDESGITFVDPPQATGGSSGGGSQTSVQIYIGDTQPPSGDYTFWYNTSEYRLYVKVGTEWKPASPEEKVIKISENPPTENYYFWFNSRNQVLYVKNNEDWTPAFKFDVLAVDSRPPDKERYKIWYNTLDKKLYVYDNITWVPVSAGDNGSDTYMVKADADDVEPGYLAQKVDEETIIVEDNKLKNKYIRQLKTSSGKHVILKNNTGRALNGDLILLDLSNILNDTSDFITITTVDGTELPFSYYKNGQFVKTPWDTIVFKSPQVPANSNFEIIVTKSDSNKSLGDRLKSALFENFSSTDINVDIWRKVGNPYVSDGKLILPPGTGLVSKASFKGSFELKGSAEVTSKSIHGAALRVATSDRYGLVKDGRDNIIDILYWSDGHLYVEWPGSERRWIRFNTKPTLQSIKYDYENKTVYYEFGSRSTRVRNVNFDQSYYIYIYNHSSSSGQLIVDYIDFSTATRIESLPVVSINDASGDVLTVSSVLDLVYDENKYKMVAKLSTGEVLDLTECDDNPIVRPYIIKPLDGDMVEPDFVVKASPYRTRNNYIGKHVSSDWEIATDELFVNKVFTSYDDSENLESINVSNLEVGKKYYVRVRYKSNDYISDWSFPVKFSVNRAPIITDVIFTEDEIYSGSEFDVIISAFDPDNNALTYELKSNDARVKIIQDENTPNKFHVNVPSFSSDVEITFVAIVRDNFGAESRKEIVKTVKASVYMVVDVFNDGSNIGLFQFEQNLDDLAGFMQGYIYQGSVDYSEGLYGYGLDTKATGAVGIRDSSKKLGRKFSVSFWVNFKTINKPWDYILFLGEYLFEIAQVVNKLKVAIGTREWRWVDLPFIITKPNQFHHIAITYDTVGGDCIIYVEGEQVYKVNSPTNRAFNIALGTRTDTRAGNANLIFDQVRFFNRVLSSDEVYFLYSSRA